MRVARSTSAFSESFSLGARRRRRSSDSRARSSCLLHQAQHGFEYAQGALRRPKDTNLQQFVNSQCVGWVGSRIGRSGTRSRGAKKIARRSRRGAKGKKLGVRAQRAPAPARPTHPTAVQAIELLHAKQATRWAARSDRFSQLMARVIRDEQKGQYLRTTSNLSSVELSELHALAPEAHDAFSIEMRDAVEHLRELLTVDPLYVLSIVAMANPFGGCGTYYEPTHEGSELKVEVVAGLLVTQPAGAEAYKAPSSEHMQKIFDELDHFLDVVMLFNWSAPRGGEDFVAML